MRVICKQPGEMPELINIQDESEILEMFDGRPKRLNVCRDVALLYDSQWREKKLPHNTVLCGQEFGGSVLLLGCAEDGFTDIPNVDGVLYTFFFAVRYGRADRANNVWNCRRCGHIEKFEADGPYENGWNLCPVCGGWILRPKGL